MKIESKWESEYVNKFDKSCYEKTVLMISTKDNWDDSTGSLHPQKF